MKKKIKRELVEWGLILAVLLGLYLTGTLGEVIGHAQQAVLWTGLIQADTKIPAKQQKQVDYDIPLLSLNGEQVNLNEFRGKVIFMNFWATWCPPCIAEMPFINKLYNKIHNKDIVFVMISTDGNLEKAKKFIQRKGFNFPVYLLAGPLPKEFVSSEIPTTFIISKKGEIVSRHKGMANYDTSRFESFLQQLARE